MQEQTPPPSPAPAPAAPVAPAASEAVATLGPPTTAQQLRALRSMRSELSNQLTSASNRRERLAEELKTAESSARPGLEARIAVLDERIVQLESDIAQTGQLLTSMPAGLVASARGDATGFRGLDSGQVTGISIVFTIFVLAPLAFAAARLMWRRGRLPARPALSGDATQRLERIEQSVEAVAIEVERVTEGQRFLTKLLSDARSPEMLAAGRPAELPRIPEGQTIHARGSEGG